MLNRLRKSLSTSLITMISLIVSAIIIFNLESLVFSVVGYRWKGPSDIYFGILVFVETFSGLWMIIIYLPRKIGKEAMKNIYAGKFPNELFGYKIAIIVGLLAGLSFSGIWKIILLATRFY